MFIGLVQEVQREVAGHGSSGLRLSDSSSFHYLCCMFIRNLSLPASPCPNGCSCHSQTRLGIELFNLFQKKKPRDRT